MLEVSTSGYYAWVKNPVSERQLVNEKLKGEIKSIHTENNECYGFRKITAELKRRGRHVNHKRVIRLMKELRIRSKVARHFKRTTNSNHTLPVAENLLNQDFTTTKPNQKMVSDITYLWTGEGWLYIAAVLDLHGQKIVGLAMGDRMNKELVIRALESAYLHAGRPTGVLIHSDRGSQYCSHEYQALIKRYGFICSMSRKGNCWDNAPMEAFWGKMKTECLYDIPFRTRAEAQAAVFKYVEVFYNRRRLHASNGYLTPEEYYRAAAD